MKVTDLQKVVEEKESLIVNLQKDIGNLGNQSKQFYEVINNTKGYELSNK